MWQPVVKKFFPNLIYMDTGSGAANYSVLLTGSEKKADAWVSRHHTIPTLRMPGYGV